MLRHGDADFILPDSARQLSTKGKSQVVKMAQTYSRNMQDIELVITSPLRRALETTELFIANAEIGCDYQVAD